MDTKELIEAVLALPVEKRIVVVHSLLSSFKQLDTEVEKEWVELAEQRLNDLNSGAVQGISGDEFFQRIGKKKRFIDVLSEMPNAGEDADFERK